MSIESELHELNKNLRVLTETLTAFSSKHYKPTREAIRESFEAIPLNDQEVAEMAEQPEPTGKAPETTGSGSAKAEPAEPVESAETAPAAEAEQAQAPTVEEAMSLAKAMLDANQKDDLLRLLGKNFHGKRVTSLNDAERAKFCEIVKAGLPQAFESAA